MYMLLDMSVKGEYSFRVKNILKKMNCSPVKEDGDDEILHASQPDFIGINYYSSICVKENKSATVNYQLHK